MDGEKGCGCSGEGGVLNFLCEPKITLKTKSIQKEKRKNPLIYLFWKNNKEITGEVNAFHLTCVFYFLYSEMNNHRTEEWMRWWRTNLTWENSILIYILRLKTKKKKTLLKYCIPLLQGYELTILKVIYVYSRIEQISQYIVDETQDFYFGKGITNKE